MNEKDLREIKRRFRPDRSNISNIVGCFVNGEGMVISKFKQSILLSEQDESTELLGVMKKVLSGSLGTNLSDIEFSTNDVMNSDEHRLLMGLRETKLADEGLLDKFYARVSSALHMDSNYVILLANDIYDVYTKEGDEGGSSTVFSYIICAVCPLKDADSGLFFRESDKLFHSISANAVLTRPMLGFMFPAFDDRCANIYHTLYYTKDLGNTYPELVASVFGKEAPMPPKEQKESFTASLSSVLGDECSYETVRSVNAQIREMAEEHKESRDPEPLVLTRATLTGIVANCGVDDEKVEKFGARIDEYFGKNAEIRPKNIIGTGSMDIKLPDIQIKVKPDKQSLISTQVIGGRKFILIDASEGVEVNGIRISVSDGDEPS